MTETATETTGTEALLSDLRAWLNQNWDPDLTVGEWWERLGLAGSLSQAGVTVDDVEAVVRMSSGSPAVRANPRPVTDDDARAILEAAF